VNDELDLLWYSYLSVYILCLRYLSSMMIYVRARFGDYDETLINKHLITRSSTCLFVCLFVCDR
jgi:hypothetical protein